MTKKEAKPDPSLLREDLEKHIDLMIHALPLPEELQKALAKIVKEATEDFARLDIKEQKRRLAILRGMEKYMK